MPISCHYDDYSDAPGPFYDRGGDALTTSARRQGDSPSLFIFSAPRLAATPARDMDGKSAAAGLRHLATLTMSASPRRHGRAARGHHLAKC